MADPGPLIKTLWVDEEIGSSIYLDAVITLVDAHLILNHLKGDAEQSHQISTYQPRKLEAMRQIALADVILINKIDLVDEAKLVEVKEALEDINLLCPKLLTQRSVVPLDSIMQINAFDGNKLVPSLAIFESAHHHHHHHHEEHRDCSGEDSCSLASQKPHSEGVTTIVIKVDGDVKSTDAVSIWFGDLLWEQKLPLYRIKGELAVDSNPHRFIVQGVHDNFEIIPTEFAWSEHLPQPTMTTGGHSLTETEKGSCTPPIIRRNTLVFIGQNLDPQAIKQSFINACLKQ
jgi:G3E family GTPase